jgi:hypothetical protein
MEPPHLFLSVTADTSKYCAETEYGEFPAVILPGNEKSDVQISQLV